jgi:imidazolonepropionase-like amidohydrolase
MGLTNVAARCAARSAMARTRSSSWRPAACSPTSRLGLTSNSQTMKSARSSKRPIASVGASLPMRIGAAGINAALEAGVDSIEHGSFLDARSLELFIAKGAFHVPTIIAGVTVLEMAQEDGLLTKAQIEKAMIVGVKIKEALARSHKAGVTIAFGTDMGVGPHGQNAREFGFMVEAGMRSRDAIKAATVNAATLLDLADEVGTIASGKSADVIAVDSSPLDDVSVLEHVSFVMAGGDVYRA